MYLQASEIHRNILTHQITPMGPLPSVLDPDGVYPYQSYCETSNRPVLKSYDFIQLENKFLSVLICPDLGGKVYSIIHKKTGKEVLYVPDVIRPSRILPRFSFVAGGIEVSFPISHTPSQNEKVNYDIIELNERIYVSMGETELRYGMQWTVEYSLGEDDGFLTQRSKFYNPTSKSHPWMSWSNAALPASEDTEFHFPGGDVLMHSDALKTIDWTTEGPKVNADIEYMSGYFWQNPDVNAFGCFSPSRNTGLYHIAERKQVPGIKLWSYGNGRDLEWSFLHSLNRQSYLEIQAGPIIDQSIKELLNPGEIQYHTEFWIPSVNPIDIKKLKIPDVELRDISEVPFFSFSRKWEVETWQLLIRSHELKDTSAIPKPPAPEKGVWPPGGMQQLEEPFKWAVAHADKSMKSLWQWYYGVWLLDLDRIEEGAQILNKSELDLARAMLGRIYNRLGDFERAVGYYNSVKEEAMNNHPQITVERDKALARLGPERIQERQRWLDQIDALNDEFMIERRIDLLIDMNETEVARNLLLKTRFQKIHQRYERKKLWKKLCKKTKSKVEPYPENLGEDNLSKFGKYREFDEN